MQYSVLLLASLFPSSLSLDDWPQFRGGPAAGVVAESGVAPSWSTTKNVAWKIEIPGRGWSSPIVSGNKIFLTSVIREGKGEEPKKGLYFGGERPKPPADVHRWMVYCIDLHTGTKLWEKEAHK